MSPRVLVPHLRKRPFTMKRFPADVAGQELLPEAGADAHARLIETAAFPASTREGEEKVIDYALVDDGLALLWMVNMGCIGHARVGLARRPTTAAGLGDFDLDPSEGATFEDVIQVAVLVRDTLDVLALESGPKTRVPRHPCARPDHAPPRVRRGARASPASSRAPSLARSGGSSTTEWTRSKRKGVLVDANQNGPGKTTASVYSVRPRVGAPVSTPLRWTRSSGLDPTAFTMDVVLDRVARDGDFFERVLSGGQSRWRRAPRAALNGACS